MPCDRRSRLQASSIVVPMYKHDASEDNRELGGLGLTSAQWRFLGYQISFFSWKLVSFKSAGDTQIKVSRLNCCRCPQKCFCLTHAMTWLSMEAEKQKLQSYVVVVAESGADSVSNGRNALVQRIYAFEFAL